MLSRQKTRVCVCVCVCVCVGCASSGRQKAYFLAAECSERDKKQVFCGLLDFCVSMVSNMVVWMNIGPRLPSFLLIVVLLLDGVVGSCPPHPVIRFCLFMMLRLVDAEMLNLFCLADAAWVLCWAPWGVLPGVRRGSGLYNRFSSL